MSQDIPDGLADILHRWRFRDLVDAHLVLDTLHAMRPDPPDIPDHGWRR